MAFTVLNAKSELTGMLHGTTLNQVVNLDGAFNRGARELLTDIDPQETIKQAQISTPLYTGLYDYSCPVDLKGNKVVDIFPQLTRNPGQQFEQTYQKNFDLTKETSLVQDFTVISTSGDRFLRIKYIDTTKNIGINVANSINENGTWAVSGTASNLSVSNEVSPSVLKFDVSTGTGTIGNSSMQGVNLTNHYNQSLLTFSIYIPDVSLVTSLSLRFGSSLANYYEKTGITTDYFGRSLQNGWNTIGVLWSDTTVVGSPDYAAIDYVAVDIIVTGSLTGVQFTSVYSRLGSIYNIAYYSKYLFRSQAGVWSETVTEDSDIINLDTDSYNLYLFQVALQCVQNIQGQNGNYDTAFFQSEYGKNLLRYKQMYKSQITKAQQPYYTRTFNGYNRYLGRGIDQN